MRIQIDIDDALLEEALRASGLPTKRAVVEAGLRALLRELAARKAIAESAGIGWEGDLDAMRIGAAAE